jgi:NAD(P)-dependent dehydrogenase (short-subunit alcohol dehydrogenase family)
MHIKRFSQPQCFHSHRPGAVQSSCRNLQFLFVAATPVARWGVINDLSGIAVCLASPASDFITGATIPVDGGYSIQG